MNEQVILINKNNKKIGVEEKIFAHKTGKLHRAFSIFIFNSRANCSYNKGLRQNITLQNYGAIQFAVILDQARITIKPSIED